MQLIFNPQHLKWLGKPPAGRCILAFGTLQKSLSPDSNPTLETDLLDLFILDPILDAN